MYVDLENAMNIISGFGQRWKTLCSKCALTTCVVLLVLSLLAIVFHPKQHVIHIVHIQTESPAIFVTNRKYLSVALDSSVIADGFKDFNMTNPKLIKLMSFLTPGYLRIGGTMADRLHFVPEPTFLFKTIPMTEQDGGVCAYKEILCETFCRPNFTMSGDEWLKLNQLAQSTGLDILFDLNALIRHQNGSWNSNNAENLISFSVKHKLNVTWELGNEPNAFKHVFNYNVNATQLAKDFVVLRKILNKYPEYHNSSVVGPDVTRPAPKHKASIKYLKEFLEQSGHILNAITWHQYYFNGRIANSIDFINPDIFDMLLEQINVIKDVVKAAGIRNKPIWLGETSSAYGGGAPGYSNRFLGTFIWLDKLGVAAENEIDVVVRQSIFKGYYALIDEHYEPAPDWWISVMYKTFVGSEVVPCKRLSSRQVRIYCHCTNKEIKYSNGPAVTIFGINLKDTEAKIRIEGLAPVLEENAYIQNIFAFIITSEITLLSKRVVLNDKILSLDGDGSLPTFEPRIVNARPYVVMPPFSLAFWIVPSPNVYFCAHLV